MEKHHICYYIVISLFTDTHAEIVYIDTVLFRSDVAIHLFVSTAFVYCISVHSWRRCIAFLQWPMTILCIMYVLRYTEIPACHSFPNESVVFNEHKVVLWPEELAKFTYRCYI